MGNFQFTEPSLTETEQVLGIFFGGNPLWGGKLLVTDHRLIFAPIDVGLVETVVRYVADKANVPGADLGGKIIDQVKGSAKKEIWIRHVTSVEPNGDGGLFKAPGVRIVTATGERVDFGIVKTTTTMNRDPANRVVRDQLIALIRTQMSRAATL